VRVLKLNYQPMWCLDISDVKFSIRVAGRDFLPVSRKVVLPIAMPLGFVFPPRVTMPLSFMRPVPNLDVATFGHEVGAASGA
jgi:hypothetical protein